VTISEQPEALALAARGALFVVNHSAGKDSQAMLIRLLRAGVPASQMVVVHAELPGVEWAGTIEHARSQAVDAGLPFHVVRAGKTLLGMVANRFLVRPSVPSWPSPSTRQCTSDLKRGPIQKLVRKLLRDRGTGLVVNCMGLRAEESSGRAKKPVFSLDARASKAGRVWWNYLPIHSLTKAEVFATIELAGQKPHWAYEQGMERLSCCFCIMASSSDLRVAARLNPALYSEYVALEDRTGYTMHASRKSLRVIVGGEDVPGGAEPCDDIDNGGTP
jgi:3'-phosphoadenosine 5'-phosphosulfate sulfotransferase (PAPS reductase)/FAD synthetase